MVLHTAPMTTSWMCFIECRIAVAVWEEANSGLSPRVCSEVNVPGKITKPANRILGKVRCVNWCFVTYNILPCEETD